VRKVTVKDRIGKVNKKKKGRFRNPELGTQESKDTNNVKFTKTQLTINL
jgi:hypothetical protein